MKGPSPLKVKLQRTTQRPIPEDGTWHRDLYIHHRKNFRPHKKKTEFAFFLTLSLSSFVFIYFDLSFVSFIHFIFSSFF
jgi:hypothetical protein